MGELADGGIVTAALLTRRSILRLFEASAYLRGGVRPPLEGGGLVSDRGPAGEPPEDGGELPGRDGALRGGVEGGIGVERGFSAGRPGGSTGGGGALPASDIWLTERFMRAMRAIWTTSRTRRSGSNGLRST
jgi:hypothetical protein